MFIVPLSALPCSAAWRQLHLDLPSALGVPGSNASTGNGWHGGPAASHCSFQATPSGCTQLTMPVARFFQLVSRRPRCLATAWSCQSEAKSGASFNHSLENFVSHKLSLSTRSAILVSRCSNAIGKYDSTQSRRSCTVSGSSDAPPAEGIWGRKAAFSSRRRISLSIWTKSARAQTTSFQAAKTQASEHATA